MNVGEGTLATDALESVQSLESERRPARRFATLDRGIAWVTEIPAAILVLIEVGVLFAGVIAR